MGLVPFKNTNSTLSKSLPFLLLLKRSNYNWLQFATVNMRAMSCNNKNYCFATLCLLSKKTSYLHKSLRYHQENWLAANLMWKKTWWSTKKRRKTTNNKSKSIKLMKVNQLLRSHSTDLIGVSMSRRKRRTGT